MEFPTWTGGFQDCSAGSGVVNVTNFNYNGEFDFIDIPTTNGSGGNGTGHWSGASSVPGVNYTVDASLKNGDFNGSVTLQNTTASAVNLKVVDSCGAFYWYAGALSPSGPVYWQSPAAGAICLQSLEWINIPAYSSVNFPVSWTGASLSSINFDILGPYVDFANSGSSVSSDSSLFTTVAGGSVQNYVPTPAPSPIVRTPNPPPYRCGSYTCY